MPIEKMTLKELLDYATLHAATPLERALVAKLLKVQDYGA